MARKKKQKQESITMEDKLKKARELRLRKIGISKKELEKNNREDFRKYFIKLKRILKLESYMENIIWLHLKASGFDTKSKFDEGVKHFGYKI
jgi:hypothetical protein